MTDGPDLRIKLVWFPPAIVLAVASVWAGATSGSAGLLWLITPMMLMALVVNAIMSRCVVREDAIFKRSIAGWAPGVLLDELHEVRFRRRFVPRLLIRPRQLHLVDRSGETFTIWPLWWTGWRPLVRLVDEAIAHDGRINYDAKTKRSLGRIARRS